MENKKNNLSWLIILVGILAIGFSTYQTMIGYSDAVGSIYMSLILSFIISISMIILLMALSRKVYERENGKVGIILFYLIFASASIFANFNTLFSGFIKEDQVSTAINNLEAKYSELSNTANQIIDDVDGISTLIRKAKSLRAILEEQIMDPSRPGYGDEAKKIAKQIADLFNIPEFSPPGGSPENQLNVILAQIDKVISANVDDSLLEQEKLLEDISGVVEESQISFGNVRQTSSINDDEKELKKYITNYNKLSSSLSGFVRNEDLYKHMPYKSNVTEIGKIPYALSQAFKREYKSSVLIALIICLLIDLFVPLLIYAVGPKKKKKRKKRYEANMPFRSPNDAKEARMNKKFDDNLRNK